MRIHIRYRPKFVLKLVSYACTGGILGSAMEYARWRIHPDTAPQVLEASAVGAAMWSGVVVILDWIDRRRIRRDRTAGERDAREAQETVDRERREREGGR